MRTIRSALRRESLVPRRIGTARNDAVRVTPPRAVVSSGAYLVVEAADQPDR
jgi:hypothetical protein